MTSGATSQPSCRAGVPPCNAHLHFHGFYSPAVCSEVKCLGLYARIKGESTQERFQVWKLRLAAPLALARADELD